MSASFSRSLPKSVTYVLNLHHFSPITILRSRRSRRCRRSRRFSDPFPDVSVADRHTVRVDFNISLKSAGDESADFEAFIVYRTTPDDGGRIRGGF